MRKIIPSQATMVPKEAKRVFQGVIYDVYQWEQELYDGSTKTFEMLKRPDTVVAIAIKDGKLVVLEQEQPSHKPFYDVPGGMHDGPNEDELQAIKREVLEETGMRFKSWRLLDVYQRHSKIEQFLYIFLAYDFIDQVEPNLDAGEKIITHLMSLEEVKQLMETPRGQSIPKDILNHVQSIEEIIKLPEYSG